MPPRLEDDNFQPRHAQPVTSSRRRAIRTHYFGRHRGYTERVECGREDEPPIKIVVERIDSREKIK